MLIKKYSCKPFKFILKCFLGRPVYLYLCGMKAKEQIVALDLSSALGNITSQGFLV